MVSTVCWCPSRMQRWVLIVYLIAHKQLAILEWSRGDISTVSLHTYERCQQMLNGDFQGYVPQLRSDPLSRLAILTLPEDALAVLPLLQEQSELDPMQEHFKSL